MADTFPTGFANVEALEDYLLTVEVDGKPLEDEALGVLYALLRTAVTVLHLATVRGGTAGFVT